MAIRFFIIWLMVAIGVFLFSYFVPKKGKRVTYRWARKALLSFVIAAILLAIVMLANNISGV